MDDMRNTSAPLYGKAEPATTKTTMSVREMRQLLGLGKTDSYWLLHKNLFEVILINDKRRIVISSFEKWYANQVKYHKVNGSPPGEELCKRSYSVPDAAEILKVKPETIYTLIRQGKLKTETADFCMRIPKEDFERCTDHKVATAQQPTVSVTGRLKRKPSPSRKWQNYSVSHARMFMGFLIAKNTEIVSSLSAWPTGRALPKKVLRHGLKANLHTNFKNRKKKRMRSRR